MKILFVNLSALRFTAATPDHAPLGGSESSLCYLARALAWRGHMVSLVANLPDDFLFAENGPTILGVRHYPLATIKDATFLAQKQFDVIILCNVPAAAAALKWLSPASHIVLWNHVLPDQASMQCLAQPQIKQSLDAVVFVSNWQKQEINASFGIFCNACVIGNGIAPTFENMFASAGEILVAKQMRATYASTPYRGLTVLAEAMENFVAPPPLDVFSSMRVYQENDSGYTALFKKLSQHPAIHCHGSVAQSVLAPPFRASAFLFYPCIYPETFCIVAAEAMAAGMKIITTRLGALEETTLGFAELVPITSQDGYRLAHDFGQAMKQQIDLFTANPEAWAQIMFTQMQQANARYSWATRAEQWQQFLAQIVK